MLSLRIEGGIWVGGMEGGKGCGKGGSPSVEPPSPYEEQSSGEASQVWYRSRLI